MNIPRLRILAVMLKEIADGVWKPNLEPLLPLGISKEKAPRFNINSWINPGRAGCGTTACAMGAACLDPRFQAMGLRLDGFQAPFPAFTVDDGTTATSFNAAAALFELSFYAALWLFDGACYPTGKACFDSEHPKEPSLVLPMLRERLDRLLQEEDGNTWAENCWKNHTAHLRDEGVRS